MSSDVTGIISWLREWFDDIYAIKGSGGGITLNDVYPVGSIYMSVNPTSPSTLFGGTWVQLEDTFLYATSTTADDNVTTAPTGQGSKDAVVVEHTHIQNPHKHNPSSYGENWVANDGLARTRVASSSTGNYYTSLSGNNWVWGGTGNATATNQNTGVDGTDKNMPPYMKVYMWKRTA